jgi:hypothetical protein
MISVKQAAYPAERRGRESVDKASILCTPAASSVYHRSRQGLPRCCPSVMAEAGSGSGL